MWMHLAAACGLLLIASGGGQGEPRVIAGRVEVAGDPNASAFGLRVILANDSQDIATTVIDRQNQFRFRVHPGRYRLRTEGQGFPSIEFGASAPGRAGREIVVGAVASVDIVLPVVRGAAIAGVVTDEGGLPVRDVAIALHQAYSEWEAVLRGYSGTNDDTRIARSDSRGAFRFHSLVPGRYVLHWAGRRVQVDAGPADEAWASLTFAAQSVPAVPLTGYVVGTDNPSGLQVRLGSRSVNSRSTGQSFESAVVTEDRFRFSSVVPDAYVVEAFLPPIEGRPALWGQTELSVGNAKVDDVVIPMRPTSTVSVTFVPTTGIALSRLTARLIPEDPPVRRDHAVMPIMSNGTSVILGTRPGRYLVELRATEGTGESLVDIQRLRVDDGSDVQLSLPLSAGDIVGTLLLEGTVEAVPSIAIFPQDPDQWLWPSARVRVARVDTDGGFRFPSVLAGTYVLAAFRESLLERSTLREVLSELRPNGLAVIVEQGRTNRLVLRVPPGW